MKRIVLFLFIGLIWADSLSAQNLQRLLEERDYREAINVIDGMLDEVKNENRSALVLQKARCLRNIRDLDGAIYVLEQETATNQSTELLAELADYLTSAKELPRALELYNALSERAPGNEYFLIQKALLENATEDYTGSLETCQRLFAKDTLTDILALAGHNYIHRKHSSPESRFTDYEIALWYYADVLKRKPVNKNAVMQMMWLYNEFADFPSAIQIAAQYLELRPDDAEVNRDYSRLLFRSKRFQEAHSAIKHQLADLRDSTAENLYLLGSCLYNLKRYREAIDAFSATRKISDDTFEVLFSLGQAWGRGDATNRDSSLYYLNRAEHYLMPDTTKLYRCESELAQLWFSGGTDFETAIIHYKKALELKPDYKDAPFRIGYSYYRLGKNAEAIRWYERYLRQQDLPKGRRERVEEEIRFLKAEEFMDNPASSSGLPE